MWKRVIWMEERIPQTMSDVDTRYRCWSSVKFAALLRIWSVDARHVDDVLVLTRE